MVETSALASSNIHLTFPLSLALFPWQPVKSAGKRHSCFQKKRKGRGKKRQCVLLKHVCSSLFPPSLSVSPLSVCIFPAQLGSNSKTSARAAMLRGQQAGWGRLCHPALPGDDQMNREALQKTTWDCREMEGSKPRSGLTVGSCWKGRCCPKAACSWGRGAQCAPLRCAPCQAHHSRATHNLHSSPERYKLNTPYFMVLPVSL